MSGTATDPAATLEALAAREVPVALDEVHALYDSLPAVVEEELLGEWEGGLVPTGHPGEAQLDAVGWVGKTFRSRDDVDPIVCRDPGTGGRVANELLGAASIRMVEHRGVVTATMVYDKHPIFDSFRRAGDGLLLGLMDRKGEPAPLAFFLRRA